MPNKARSNWFDRFKTLIRMPDQFLAQCISRASAANNNGQYDIAIGWCQKALKFVPNLPEAWYNLGLAYSGKGQTPKAIDALRKTAALTPNDPDAQNSIGLQFINIGAYPEAERCLQKSLALAPNYVLSLSNLGLLRNKQKRFDVAESIFRKAIDLRPDFAPLHTNLGAALNSQRKYESAEVACRKAIEIDPRAAEAWSNLASSFCGRRHYEAAEAACRKAIGIHGRVGEAWSNLSSALCGLNNYEAAEAACRKAIEIDPRAPEAWINLAFALCRLKRYEAAEAACRKAIDIDPRAGEAWINLAFALCGAKRHQEAVECFRQGLEIAPGAEYALGAMVHARMHVCDWAALEAELGTLMQKIGQGDKVAEPFIVLGLTENPSIQRKAAEIFVKDRYPENGELGPIPRHPGQEKIRIGYYSADFREHAVSYLMAEVFELHDRERFELIGFAFGKRSQDEIRQRLSRAFDQFIDVRDKSDRQVAEMSRAMNIDIAIDLGGYTEDHRTGIFAMRAAPIQVSYIGYLGTMGAPYIDYLLADKIIVPEDHQQYYSEKIAYLPSYQANDSKRRIPERVFTREELGLPNNGFVCCCFNMSYKVTPQAFDSWMRILKQARDSVLFLYADNDTSVSNLKKEAEHRGVDGNRLVFGKRLLPSDYLARYRVADLFLDTFPYNAGTTASDALWTGLPVLTYCGAAFASRVAASLLSAIGLPELITSTREDFEALAIQLATQPGKLAQIKQKLERNRLTAALFDTLLFTGHIEAAYTAMYERYGAGLPPENIYVTDQRGASGNGGVPRSSP